VASPHSAKLTGQLVVSDQSCAPRSTRSITIPLGLLEDSAGDAVHYTPSELINSASPGWQSMPIPAGAAVKLLYIRAVSSRRDTFSLRLTRASSGQQVTSSHRGLYLAEYDPEDAVEAVEVQGELSIEYLAVGET
jgi:hypothetical protein